VNEAAISSRLFHLSLVAPALRFASAISSPVPDSRDAVAAPDEYDALS
jgi:hypothetical protein